MKQQQQQITKGLIECTKESKFNWLSEFIALSASFTCSSLSCTLTHDFLSLSKLSSLSRVTYVTRKACLAFFHFISSDLSSVKHNSSPFFLSWPFAHSNRFLSFSFFHRSNVILNESPRTHKSLSFSFPPFFHSWYGYAAKTLPHSISFLSISCLHKKYRHQIACNNSSIDILFSLAPFTFPLFFAFSSSPGDTRSETTDLLASLSHEWINDYRVACFDAIDFVSWTNATVSVFAADWHWQLKKINKKIITFTRHNLFLLPLLLLARLFSPLLPFTECFLNFNKTAIYPWEFNM